MCFRPKYFQREWKEEWPEGVVVKSEKRQFSKLISEMVADIKKCAISSKNRSIRDLYPINLKPSIKELLKDIAHLTRRRGLDIKYHVRLFTLTFTSIIKISFQTSDKNFLPARELNYGLLRERRGYLPTLVTKILFSTICSLLGEMTVNPCDSDVTWISDDHF